MQERLAARKAKRKQEQEKNLNAKEVRFKPLFHLYFPKFGYNNRYNTIRKKIFPFYFL